VFIAVYVADDRGLESVLKVIEVQTRGEKTMLTSANLSKASLFRIALLVTELSIVKTT
jgi:hypothetical protein